MAHIPLEQLDYGKLSIFDVRKISTQQVTLTNIDLTPDGQSDYLLISWNEDGIANGMTMDKQLFLEMLWEFNYKNADY